VLIDTLLKAGATAIVIVTAVGLFVMVRRLRTSPPRGRRAFWLGAVAPVAATATYLYVGAPAYALPVLIGSAAVGLAVGVWTARAGGRPMAVDRGQRGVGLLVWAIAYVAAALTSVTGSSFYQAAGAAGLAAAAGVAVGVQVGLIARPRILPPAAATAGLGIMLVAMLTLGPSVGLAFAGTTGQPDPCVFIVESIWPGTLQPVPGIVRTGGDDLPSCGASFEYAKDAAGKAVLGGITVTRYGGDADAREAVESLHAQRSLQAAALGDLGYQGTYEGSAGKAFVAIFSVHNYVGWLGGSGSTPALIDQGTAAAARLAESMKAAVGPAPSPSPTPTPHPTAPPTVAPTIAPTNVPTLAPTPGPTGLPAPTPTPSLGPAPSPTLAPDQLGVSISCAQDLTAKPYTVACTASPLNPTVGAALQYAWTWELTDDTGTTTNGRGDKPGTEFTRLFTRGSVTVTVVASDVVAKKESPPASATVELDTMADLAEMLTLGAKVEPQTIDEALKGVFGGMVAIGLGLGLVGPSRKPGVTPPDPGSNDPPPTDGPSTDAPPADTPPTTASG
jgi:hypothetical protein